MKSLLVNFYELVNLQNIIEYCPQFNLNLHVIIVFIVTKVPQVDYCASKFACVGLDEALRVETLVQVISALIDLYFTPLLMQKFPTS